MSNISPKDKQKIQERRQKAYSLVGRYTRLFSCMEQATPYQGKRRIVLCISLLTHSCLSFLIDIERHMPFHNIKIPNNHKKAAFIFKWISRIQPVHPLPNYCPDLTGYENCANANFALICALSELKVDVYKFMKTDESKVIRYSSVYRDINPESWAIIFGLLEKNYPST